MTVRRTNHDTGGVVHNAIGLVYATVSLICNPKVTLDHGQAYVHDAARAYYCTHATVHSQSYLGPRIKHPH